MSAAAKGAESLCYEKYLSRTRKYCILKAAVEILMYPYLVFLSIFFGAPTLLLAWRLRREIVQYRRTARWLLIFVFTVGWL
jgi:hypothetical protein